jgi:hypothetical protein
MVILLRVEGRGRRTLEEILANGVKNMQCLSREQMIEWMVRHLPAGSPIQTLSGLPLLAEVGYSGVSNRFPTDSGRKAMLAKIFLKSFGAEETVLVYLRGWQIFPSGGHMPLLLRLRQSLGESRSLTDYPAHLFSKTEVDDAISVVILALEFFWDCFLMGETGELTVFISHDEYYEILAASPSAMDHLTKMLLEFHK